MVTNCSRPLPGRFNFKLKLTSIPFDFDRHCTMGSYLRQASELFLLPLTSHRGESTSTGMSSFVLDTCLHLYKIFATREGDLFCHGRSGFFGWMGFGGSCFQWNPQLKIGFAFVPTELEIDLTNMRAGMLQEAVVRVVTNRSSSTSTEPWWPLE